MASIERTAYPRFNASLSERELAALYEPTPGELAFARKSTRSSSGELTLLVLLKCYQHLGYLPAARDVPDQIKGYLAGQIGMEAKPELGASQRQARHRYRAFRELGRVVRTIFLLEYISTAELRRNIHAATTKIESYNAFSDWLSFGGDIIRSGDPVEQEKRVKYRDLVASAVMLRNVADLTDVLADLKADGHDFTRDQVARLSPYMTTHLKRFGQYVLDMDGQPSPLEPKSLDLVDEASPLR